MYYKINRFLVMVMIISSITAINAFGQNYVGMLYCDEDKYFDGYTLFSPIYSKITYLIDMDGNIAHIN